MRYLIHIGMIGLLLLGACSSEEKQRPPVKPAVGCPELGRLLDMTEFLESNLSLDVEWAMCRQALDSTLKMLEKNVRTGDEYKKCHYLNGQQFPDRPRLLFVESLRDRIERDTLPGGIKYMIRLRGIFSEDATLEEWFSEELAHIALRNTTCFSRYLARNMDQETMLTYSTKWNPLDLDTLIMRFERQQASDTLLHYLHELRIKAKTGI